MSTFIALVSQRPRVFGSSSNFLAGRTARIGNEGLATSFYNDRDESMADYLVKILVESKQEIPVSLRIATPPV